MKILFAHKIESITVSLSCPGETDWIVLFPTMPVSGPHDEVNNQAFI